MRWPVDHAIVNLEPGAGVKSGHVEQRAAAAKLFHLIEHVCKNGNVLVFGDCPDQACTLTRRCKDERVVAERRLVFRHTVLGENWRVASS